MSQRFKTVYFSDHPAATAGRKHVRLAFGDRDQELFALLRPLSSHEMREMLGHSSYETLKAAADADDLALNTFCVRLLRERALVLREPCTQYTLPGVSESANLVFPAIHATFRGGEREPFHLWYPFLEGYSPRFVQEILREYAPQARRVMDPFAGTGTTPLTAARLGLATFYCELNPLLQGLISAKTKALTLTNDRKEEILDALTPFATGFAQLLDSEPPDCALDFAHARVFGRSQFFAPNVYQLVLRARGLIDRVASTSPIVADFLTVAVVSSLIPGSLLIRRGDLRFKTAQEAGRLQQGFVETVESQLERILADLSQHPGESRQYPPPSLVCEDAKNLGRLPFLNIDAVVTSPPYLNGTNYFRNTKLELWFLRCLHTADDLADFRTKAVTAGINDVSARKSGGSVHPAVREVVDRLAQNAYDPRIPRMVESYFQDMSAVFAGLRYHLAPDAVIAIDIGDSIYGGVPVRTDQLLCETLHDLGFQRQQELLLRRRLSRGGGTLRQVLLTFRAPGPTLHDDGTVYLHRGIGHRWESAWLIFKRDLPHQQDPFCKRNWGHRLHSLCSYEGKMKPSLAAHLVQTFLPPGGAMLDPFAGVGTIPFEAAVYGVKAFGFDISPAALSISAAKLGLPSRDVTAQLLKELEDALQNGRSTAEELVSAQAITFNGRLPDYYNEQTLQEILLARRFFLVKPPLDPSAHLVFASLLHILHGNRPYALSRRSHPITPFAPTGPAEYRALMPRLREKVERGLAVEYPAMFVPGQVYRQDATSWWPQSVRELDAVITSPPFFDSTRFYLSNWLRLWFCGWERADFQSKPLAFIDERQKASFSVYEPVFRQARERLKPGGVVVLHLGKSVKCDMAAILAQTAAPWFRVADHFSENVTHCESHGIRDKGTVQEHQYLVLR
jgi:hypothetical protein